MSRKVEARLGCSAGEIERVSLEVASVLEHDLEVRGIAREHRRHTSGAHVKVHQVAEGVQDGDDAQAGEQEGEHITEREVVVDRSDQHQDKHTAEAQTVTRRQDVDAALSEEYHAGLRPVPSEYPLV
jgi:hypothetical protein